MNINSQWNAAGVRRRTQRGTIKMLAVVSAVAFVAGCGSDNNSTASEVSNVVNSASAAATGVARNVDSSADDLAQTLRDNGLDSIAGIVEQIDVGELFGDTSFTFFAPDDDAFTTLGADQTADLLANPSDAIDILRNHTLAQKVSADELKTMDSVETEDGNTLPVSVTGDSIEVGDVHVAAADIEFGDGVIHVVDGFLVP